MRKSFLIYTLLVILTQTTEVEVRNQCDCDKLLSLADCKAKLGCTWSFTNVGCSKISSSQ